MVDHTRQAVEPGARTHRRTAPRARVRLEAAYEDASRTIAANMQFPTAVEGVEAFLQKRPPKW